MRYSESNVIVLRILAAWVLLDAIFVAFWIRYYGRNFMCTTVLNPPRPPSIVRIHCNKCSGPNPEHERCPGVLETKGVRFECQCACHATLPLFEGAL